MALQLEHKLFTVDEYEQMIAAGILTKDDHVELILGDIVEMAPKTVLHASCTSYLTTFFIRRGRDDAVVFNQSPMLLSASTMPQPDLAIVKPPIDPYKKRRPTPADVYLLIEVADISLAYDKGVKIPLYAEADISEVWLVNLNEKVVEVYTQPSDGQYHGVRSVGKGEMLALPGGLEGALAVDEILI